MNSTFKSLLFWLAIVVAALAICVAFVLWLHTWMIGVSPLPM